MDSLKTAIVMDAAIQSAKEMLPETSTCAADSSKTSANLDFLRSNLLAMHMKYNESHGSVKNDLPLILI